MIVDNTKAILCWLWHLVKMAFLKRKRFKFNVDLQLVHLSDVPLVNAVLFAKGAIQRPASSKDVLEEHLLNPVDRKAPPGDDKIEPLG
ncbi:hypothetical protein Tcan_13985 [Toxocara canis]|uniref:Uncharacterized protein n=1 Tax=Toxocara canis TaxID=6265 RepID=A0A0B2VXI1_TOXCA|nr:hypothetical protein Tcan_13985 [Toxocara canis]